MNIGRRQFLGVAALAACGTVADASVVKRQLPAVDLSFIKKKMAFSPRSEWTRQAQKAWRMRGIGDVDRVTIHHTAGGKDVNTDKDDVAAAIQGVLASHTQRGYGDIAYHLIIDYSGRVWEGRPLAYEGAHVQDQNERNIGIMLLGNFEIQEPSKKQIDSMKQLVDLVRAQYRIKRHRIYGHRDLGASACPGTNLYVYVQKLKEGKL